MLWRVNGATEKPVASEAARCILWRVDGATEKPVASEEEPEDVHLSESETESEDDVTGKPVACETAVRKPCASSKSDCQGPKVEKIEWSHNLHVSQSSGRSMDENTMTL